VTTAARALRLDEDSWRWLVDEAKLGGATLIVVGAYLVLAFDRFGWPDFALRPTARLVLTGVYGWVGLALAGWAVTRSVSGAHSGPTMFIRLTGHAHLPLLLLAILIQVVSVMSNVTSIARWPTLFVGLFWFPALLTNAVAGASGLDRARASAVVAVPYLLWAAAVGRLLWRQLGHLL
jgi:hypothetical protein